MNLPAIITSVMVAVVLLFVFTQLLEYLWNTTMPQVFNLKLITFWQAFRLLLIASLLMSGGIIHYNLVH